MLFRSHDGELVPTPKDDPVFGYGNKFSIVHERSTMMAYDGVPMKWSCRAAFQAFSVSISSQAWPSLNGSCLDTEELAGHDDGHQSLAGECLTVSASGQLARDFVRSPDEGDSNNYSKGKIGEKNKVRVASGAIPDTVAGQAPKQIPRRAPTRGLRT